MPACEPTSSLPGEPETPTAPTTSLPPLIGSPPASASTRVYWREPTVSGLSVNRFDEVGGGLAERARGMGLAFGAFRGVQASTIPTQHHDRKAGRVDDRYRNLEPHAFALGDGGLGDRRRHRE